MRLLLPILLVLPLAHCAAPPVVLDLSYKHYVGVEKFEKAIRSCSWDLPCEDRPENLHVDISASVLNDAAGFKRITESLFPADFDRDTATTSVSFLARRNRITPKSLHDLFQKLLRNTPANRTTEATPSVDTGNATTNQSNPSATEVAAETNATSITATRAWTVEKLDIGWNALHSQAPGFRNFLKSLQALLQSPELCPQSIRLERCGLSPAVCRAMGKGIINRYSKSKDITKHIKPLSLHLCGNPDLGDSGSAAIAAAIRMVASDDKLEDVVLDTLDLSACDIGDAGAEALALALESSPRMCIRHLDLSHNKISDVGAAAIGQALLVSGTDGPLLQSLDLSGNTHIKDPAAIAIAEAVGKGLVSCIKMRSCYILAEGAAAFGKALAKLAKGTTSTPTTLEVDLSGNPLGVLRGKSKKGGKYSASAIKSKASATTAAYMSILQKGIKKGLKEYGVEIPGNSAESDDEEEARNGMGDDLVGDGELDPKKARCGIKAFANAILDEETSDQESVKTSSLLKCNLGLRRCFPDHGAANALAALLVHCKDEIGIDLKIDVALNPVLEEEMVDAIQGVEEQDDLLREMSDRYLDELEVLREACERAAESARIAGSRIQEESEYESQWGDIPDGFDDNSWEEEEDEWDSDADYDDPEDEYF